ncbi:hypothetical protein FRX31_007924 [Thalictrum thalictroides]|uniref:Uncharacterized protein n=1 Tax=Thalictrum thalictroides TaxID=46969 RepID=A0A7J6X142_THATH|nr:hypothetical protein FRX31_007924 [Thalictrum thalictroides]
MDDFEVDEYLGDSLREVQDMSLRLSFDGDKTSLDGSLQDGGSELEKMASDQNGPEPQDQVKQILSKIRKPPSQQQNCDGGI